MAYFAIFARSIKNPDTMSLQDKVMAEMKEAMRAKDSNKLEALRAVKSAILLARTNASGKDGLSEDEELKLLQRLVKQRKESEIGRASCRERV